MKIKLIEFMDSVDNNLYDKFVRNYHEENYGVDIDVFYRVVPPQDYIKSAFVWG